jgi:hypothetical protein
MIVPPLLISLGIDQVSGRPLHSYHIGDSAYARMQESLQRALPSAPKPLAHSMCFVAWAAEKFRRDFQGGSTTWSFLFDAINMPVDQNLGRNLVQDGLAKFGRPAPRQTDAGIIYLKTLVAEGGLPEHLLGDAGRYRRMVWGLMQDIETLGAGAPEGSLRILAAHRAAELAAGFQTDEFHTLLAGFAVQLVELKALCPSDLPAAAREGWLNAQRPGWRDALPLRIESVAAQSLLRDALRADYQLVKREVVERSLLSIGPQKWRAQMSVSDSADLPGWLLGPLPAGVQRFRLRPDLAMSEACPSLMLSVERDDRTAGLWTVKRESGLRTARFDFPLDQVASFQMLAEGRIVGTFAPPGGDGLSSEQMPTFWALESGDALGAPQRLRRLGSASVRTKSDRVWLLVGGEAAPKADETLILETAGKVGLDTLWLVSGSGYVFGNDGGWRFRVTTAAENDEVDRLIGHGAITEGLRDMQGGPIWLGCPQFMIDPAQGSVRSANPSEFLWRVAGHRNWRNGLPPLDSFGTIQVGWRGQEGAVQAVETLRLAPRSARFRTTSLSGGGVRVEVSGLPPGIMMSVERCSLQKVGLDGSVMVDIIRRETESARFSIVLFDTETGQRLEATGARPSDRGWIIAPGDRLLQYDEVLALDGLRGWRFTVPEGRSGHIQVRLVDTIGTVSHPKVLIDVASEAAITAFLPLLRGLLAIGGPDAQLRIRLVVGQHESPRLTVRRFTRSTRWSGSSLIVAEADEPHRLPPAASSLGAIPSDEGDSEAEMTGQIDAMCVNLTAPEMTVLLTGIHPGTNVHDALFMDGGPWFVLPRDSAGMIRPPSPLQTDGSEASVARLSEAFVKAGSAATRAARITAFVAALRELTLPLAAGDVALFECLLNAVGDASDLAVLDQILALSKVPEVAVLLVLRAAPDRLGDRLALEDFSPFSWVTTPVSAWEVAMRCETARLSHMFAAMGLPEQQPQTLAEQQVSARLCEIILRRMDLAGHALLAAQKTALFPKHMALFGRIPPEISTPKESLLRLAREAVMRQEGANQPFPELAAQVAPPGFETLNPAMRGLIHTPLIAAEYVTGKRQGPPPAHIAIAIQHFRTHDPAYFDAALPAAIAWLL